MTGTRHSASRHGEQRLGLFGQGRRADRAHGSRWLAVRTASVSRPEVLRQATADELLGIGRAWKALETWTFCRKLAVVRELIRRHPLHERGEPGAAAGGLPDEWDPRLHHEVAAALGISLVAAGKLVNLAWTLVARLPGIGKALEHNLLDPPRVRMIADETSVLDDGPVVARAEAIVMAGLKGCRTWSDLQRLVQRAVIMADPDGARKRREQAEREHARIRFWRENTGTCGLQGTGLPADEALAANARIEGRARAYKAARIGYPMDILRVMAYLDLINEVTIAQRVAWAQADAAARAAAADEQAARDARLREQRDKASDPEQDPGTGDSPGDADPRAGHPGDGPDGSGQGDPDSDGHSGPDDGGCGGDVPGRGGSGPDGGHPDGDEPGGGPGTGYPGDDPDGEPGGEPGDWPLPDDPGDDFDDWIPPDAPDPPDPPGEPPDGGDREPCSACRGAGGGIGLPVRANLTLPAAALGWLAERAAGDGWGSTRDPGTSYRGGPGPCPACGRPDSARMPALDNLTLPLLTLLGLAERAGEAHGLGALDAALARYLTAAGARHPASQFCITITDERGHAIGHGCGKPMRGPGGQDIPGRPGQVTLTPSGRPGPDGGYGSWILTLPGASRPLLVGIDPVPTYSCDHRLESGGHDPGDRLRHLIQVRDGKCSFPACSRHARDCDFEHARPYEEGGRTCGCNAHCASRSCHRAKQSPGWAVTKPQPGWTRWTTAAGRVYQQGPWRYPM